MSCFDYTLLAVVVVDLLATAGDITLSWTSPIYPKLYSADPSVNPLGRPITENEDSWLGSLLNFGAIIGPALFSYIGEKFGRKIGLLSVAVPHFIAFISMAFATHIYIFYLARILGGLAIGGGYSLLPTYIAEISRNKNRGAMSQTLITFWAIGNFLPYAIGPFMSILWFNLILSLVPFVFCVLFIILGPESPYYLVKQNKIDKAEKSLMLLRSQTKEEIQEELTYIKKHLKMSEDGGLCDIFRDPVLRKYYVLCMIFICTQELSGFCAITYHLQLIFEATGTHIPADISALIVGFAIFITSFPAQSLIDRSGRKSLIIWSCFGMCLAHILIGIFFYIQDSTNLSTKPIFWLPIFSLIFYIFAFNLGICCVPWTLVSELFPDNVKHVAVSTGSSLCYLTSFVTTSYFNDMNDSLGKSGTFWTFAVFCLLAGMLSIIAVPETKGKSFIEIQEMIRGQFEKEDFMLEKLDIQR